MTRDLVDFGAVATAGIAATVAAVVAYGALAVIAKPAGFSGRAAAVENRATIADAGLKDAPAAVFPTGAVCADTTETAVGALRARVQAAAQAAGVQVQTLTAAAGAPGQDGLTLGAVNLQLQANGRYDAVMAMLGTLANSRPDIFVDTADLTSKTSSVDLKLQGRVFCSASARP